MDLSQKVAFNALVQMASKTTTVVFGLLLTILLTGYLGRDGYGDYMYIITLVVLFGALADWGTAAIGVREAAQRRSDQGRILSNILLVRLVITFGAAFLMSVAAFFLPLQSGNPVVVRQGIVLGSLILLLFATKASFGIIFQTKLQMQKLAVADIVASFLTLLISWFLVRWGLGLLPLIGSVAVANVVALLIVWFLARRTIEFDFSLDKVFIGRFIRESLPMGAILLVFTVDNKIDTVMLGSMKGSGAVGIYAVAYRVYDVLLLGAAYLMNALLPVISANADLKRHKKKLRQIYQSAFDVLLVMGIGVFLAVLVLAPLVVRILTQQRFLEFGDSVLALRILSVALFLTYFNHLTGYTIVALGCQRPYFFIALAALVFNVTANSFLIPLWSYNGAALVTILTEGLVLAMTTVLIFRLLGILPSLSRFPKTLVLLFKERGKIF